MDENREQFYHLRYGTGLQTSFFRQGDLLLMEIEHADQPEIISPDVFLQSRDFVDFLDKSSDLRELCNYVAAEVRKISGYDRVMVYRFDNQFNGEVFAESLHTNVESFLGLHYPHTDIPPQARLLFEKNLLRMIPNVHYTPVPVLSTLENATNESLDMSLGGLRSVSPVHIEYLKNMGVGASLTVSLMHNKKLWGLIACHHNSPKAVASATRTAIKLQAHFLTSQISKCEALREHELSMAVNQALIPMLKDIRSNTVDQYIHNAHLYQCINADGIAILTNGKIYTVGITPSLEQIKSLAAWFHIKTDTDHFFASRLDGEYPQAHTIKDTAAGVFFHSLSKESDQGVIWFRGEKKNTIFWAGNPNGKLEKDDGPIMPRKSFAAWKQVIAGSASRWEKPEQDAAIRLSTKIQNNIFLQFITAEEKKYRLQAVQLMKVNEELGNFNHVCSHDLQEPIRKILIFSNILMQGNDDAKGELLRKIHESSLRAVRLINDLLRFAGVSNYSAEMQDVNLDECVERILKDFELIIAEKGAVVTNEILGSIRAIPVQVEQLLNNLIANSLKFSGDDKVVIKISIKDVESKEIKELTGLDPQFSYNCITVQDNGIGFDQHFAEKIFTIFSRLHNSKKYAGSGIGLAICKKIAANHNGEIVATSKTGQGAAFSIYLQKQQHVPENYAL